MATQVSPSVIESLGEIYLQTQIPLEEIQQVIQDLTNRGYLKRIEGKINRYIAVEPFLKGFLFVEKEFQNDIINIENSLINSLDTSVTDLSEKLDQFKGAIPPIYTKISEELRNGLKVHVFFANKYNPFAKAFMDAKDRT